MPGGIESSAPGGGVAIRTLSLMTVFSLGITGHRIGAHLGLLHVRLVAPQVVAVPFVAESLVDIEVGVLEIVWRAFDLDVAAGAELEFFAFGQRNHKLLDEARDVAVRDDRAVVAFDAEDFVGDLDSHVLLDGDLAGRAGSDPLHRVC